MVSYRDTISDRELLLVISYYCRHDSRPTQVGSSQIISSLYLGSVGAAYTQQVLLDRGITHILTLDRNLPPQFPSVPTTQTFTYLIVPLEDQPTMQLSPHLSSCTKFINDALQSGGKVLVHCLAGVSRAPVVVMAYFMRCKSMTFNQALALVREKRPWIKPNQGFIRQLEDLQRRMHRRHSHHV